MTVHEIDNTLDPCLYFWCMSYLVLIMVDIPHHAFSVRKLLILFIIPVNLSACISQFMLFLSFNFFFFLFLFHLSGFGQIDTDGLSDFPASAACSKDLMTTQVDLREDESSVTPTTSHPPKFVFYSTQSSGGHDLLPNDLHQKDLKTGLMNDLKREDEHRFGSVGNNDGFDSLESLVRIKEAEALMFQSKADEARREADSYMRMIRSRSEKLEEEYAEKLSKLRLQETEEKRRKKVEELQVLEHSHSDYYKTKLRMQADIANLLDRMEATKSLRV